MTELTMYETLEKVVAVMIVISLLPLALVYVDAIIVRYPVFASILGLLVTAIFFFFIKFILPNMAKK